MSEFWLKVDKTLRYHGNRVAQIGRDVQWQLARPATARPIFIVGCSRAGTTLVYKTLSESSEVGSLQRETHDFWMDLHPLAASQWETHALQPKDIQANEGDYVKRYFYKHTGRSRFVDKNNQSGLCIGFLHALFSDAHFIYVKRSPGDNINSLIEGWNRPEEFATWSGALPATVKIEQGQYTQWCFFLFSGWRNYLNANIEDVCRAQYVAMNQAIFAARKQVPDKQWTEVFYEDFLRDPVQTFQRVFESSGLTFTPQLQQHCETVLSKPYNAFSEIRLDKWRDGQYADKLEQVIPQASEVSTAMGY